MTNLVRRAYDELIDLPKGAAVASGLLSLLLFVGAGSLWRSGSWWALPVAVLAVGAALLLVLSLRWGLAVERGQTDKLPPTDPPPSAEPPSNVRRFD
jgi:hypothetical protein